MNGREWDCNEYRTAGIEPNLLNRFILGDEDWICEQHCPLAAHCPLSTLTRAGLERIEEQLGKMLGLIVIIRCPILLHNNKEEEEEEESEEEDAVQ